MPETSEIESTVQHTNGDEGAAPRADHIDNATEDLISNAKSEIQSNGKADVANAETSKEPEEEPGKAPSKESKTDHKPSERVREGRKWNDRPRRYNDKDDRTKYKRNNKSNLVSQEESSDPIAIRKQVEFYFSDSNLLQDKFLFTKVEGHENLPVPISVIHSFRRMQHFQPLSAIIDALKESTTLNVVENDTCVQRKEPLPEGLVGKPMVEIQQVHEDKSMARSIYAKGFGDEEPSTQFDLEAFFANYGPTNSVRLRRTYDHTFKGSVFVEFDSESTQKSFLALDPKPKWQGNELQIKSKKQYCDDKVEDIKAGKVRPKEDDDRGGHHYKSPYKRRRDSPDYERGEKGDKDDERDWRDRRDEDRKSGFRGKGGGKHRGFGSSGRGRGGRDGRGLRDRNDERNSRDQRGVPTIKPTVSDSGEKENSPPEAAKKDDTSTQTGLDTPQAENGNGPPSVAQVTDNKTTPGEASSSKKRAREEDDNPEGEVVAKKLDTKSEES